jgi:uncharacterized cofD-like protein
MQDKKRVVVIGGGTGNFVVLSGLKKYYKEINIVTIVDMTDSGGSNKRLIDEFGLLPTSDIKQCLVALSPETSKNSVLRQLFNYRFVSGEGIKGHHFGNLFMAALSDIMGSQKAAIEKTQEILKVHGKIVPVTYEKCELVAEYEDGSKIKSEHLIDEPENHNGKLKIVKLYTKPKIKANSQAIEEIKRADLIILCPGDLYTSVLANIVIDDVAKAIRESKAQKAYVMNLMTKMGQTYGFTARDHLRVLNSYLGKTITYVLINTGKISREVIDIYARENENPVVDDLSNEDYKVIRGDFLNRQVIPKNSADILKRSLVRHNPDKLASELIKLI